MKLFQVGLTVLAVSILTACGGSGVRTAAGHIDFNDDIRPVLSDSCFKCHGPDTATRKAGLRLDLPGPAYAEIPEDKGKFAVVPGKPQASELIRRITSSDPSERMPKGKPPLTPEQIALLTEWVKQGAPYKPLWSLIAPVRPAIVKTKFDARAVNDIDRLVYAKLEKTGVTPSKEADRATLINRVSLTLTGLPPTLEQVDAFDKDTSPNAYEKLVDRLLASPAYGERMASMWMDLARWSDTDGGLDDLHDRYLWPWRDWVIHAFQDNMPFDRFVTWQLSGDLIPNHSRDQLLATAFLRLGERTTENGALNEQFRIESVVDKTNTVGTAFLGLTVGCARCHDHKFDVISQKDYYSMSGFFNSLDEPGVYAPGATGVQGGPTLPWPTPEQQAQLTKAETALAQQSQHYQAVVATASRGLASQVASLLQPSRTMLHPISFGASSAASPAAALQLVSSSVAQAQAAYYPFDEVQTIPPSAYPTLKPAPLPPLPEGLMIQLKRPLQQFGPAATKGKGKGPRPQGKRPPPLAPLPRGYSLALARFSPAGMASTPPVILEDPQLDRGVKGKAFYFTATDSGYFSGNVGNYDRTQQFSFDFWFYPADKYKDSVPVFSHTNAQSADAPDSGVTGYELEYDQQRLVFYMAHIRPWNMLAAALKAPLPLKQWTHVTLTYDGSSKVAGLQIYLNGKPQALEVIRDHLTETALPHAAVSNLDPSPGLTIGMRFREPSPVGSALDELRIFNRALTPTEVGYLHEGARALQADSSLLKADLTGLLALRDPRVQGARQALDAARGEENQIRSSIPEVLVMGDRPKPRPTYLLNRGVYDQRVEQVPVQGLKQIFAWSTSLPPNRIGLAQWLLDRKNPLTARVFVNRLWQLHFGTGIVKTAEDFGSQGSLPTNPQLLDWMAVEFMDSGWDIKHLQKLIVMSATYRQSSNVSEAMRAQDPTNALLERGPRFRMTAQMIRDSALADAGLLVPQVGGPSVYPYQPEGVWDAGDTIYTYPSPKEIPADEQHRRSVYTFNKRNELHPGLLLLDAADPTVSIARLNASNTPLQALLLLNDVQYQEAYRAMATRALEGAADENAQLTLAFRLARRLYPTTEQLGKLRSYYDDQLGRYQGDTAAAKLLVNVGVSPVDPKVDVVKMAAMTNVCAAVMNTPDSYFIH